MASLAASAVHLLGALPRRALENATRDPQAAQARLLERILARNRDTEFGRRHSFASLRNGKDYSAAVPVSTFDDLTADVARTIAGEENILTADRPMLYNITSGTTGQPKLIPVTRKGRDRIAVSTLLWFRYALNDHPAFLDGDALFITGAAVEKRTALGLPCGSASGMILDSLPGILHRSFVPTRPVAAVADYELRYRLIARLALERRVSVVATPNASTLLKIARASAAHQEEIVRAVRDGRLLDTTPSSLATEERKALEALGASLRPNVQRARQLEEVIRKHGRLLPFACWESLQFVGCWLGGSAGMHAQELAAYYGTRVPLRDLGFLSSEATITIPAGDGSAAGILALPNAYYEFLPETDDDPAAPVLCHELEVGRRYRILLTNWNGLYRYDIRDVVEVQGFHHRTPLLAFVRKTADFLNITGEKLHVNHLLLALGSLGTDLGVRVRQFRAVSSQSDRHYELLLCFEQEPPADFLRDAVLPAVDGMLRSVNIEYDSKRASGRLAPPVLHVMETAWPEAAQRHDVANGRRDIQYKWRAMAERMSELDARHIRQTFRFSKETLCGE